MSNSFEMSDILPSAASLTKPARAAPGRDVRHARMHHAATAGIMAPSSSPRGRVQPGNAPRHCHPEKDEGQAQREKADAQAIGLDPVHPDQEDPRWPLVT